MAIIGRGFRASPSRVPRIGGTIQDVSTTRQQTFVDAPIEIVWELVSDVERHPEWWPRVIEVKCEGLEEGCTYRQVTKTPVGRDEMELYVDRLEDCRNLSIHCLNTGTFVRMELAEAQGGTFVEGEMGMEPQALQMKIFDTVAGKRYFRSWLAATFDALRRVAPERAEKSGAGDALA
jgi:uncharacterized protein YndB with AHSA1/START domain